MGEYLGVRGTLSAKGRPGFLCRRRNALLDGPKAVQCGAHVEREHGRAIRFRRCRIVVNNITDFFTSGLTLHYPVVAIKRCFRATLRKLAVKFGRVEGRRT